MATFLTEDSWVDVTSQITDDTWSVITVIPPVGTTGAIVTFIKPDGANTDTKAGTRGLGGTEDGFDTYRFYANQRAQQCHYVGLTANQFEAIKGTGVLVYISGWLESEDAAFSASFTDLGPFTEDAWNTVDCSALVPANATAVIIRSYKGSSQGQIGFRTATAVGVDDDVIGSHPLSAMDFIIPLTDSSKSFDVYVTAGGTYTLQLHGWCLERFLSTVSVASDEVESLGFTANNVWETKSPLADLEDFQGLQVIATGGSAGGRIGVRQPDQTTYDADFNAYGLVPFSVGAQDGVFQARTRYGGYFLNVFGAFAPSQTSSVTVSLVNSNDIIAHNGSISISGTGLDSVTSVVLDDGTNQETLTISGTPTPISITCDPYDVYSGKLKYDSATLRVVSPTNNAERTVQINPDANTQFVNVVGVQPYLAQGLAVQDGDQMACEKTLSGSTMTLTPDTDILYDPAVSQGAQHTRYWWDQVTQVWDSGEVTVNGNVVGAPVWRATPNPPPCVVGVPYQYSLGALLDGERPMTLTNSGTPLPAGLSYGFAAAPNDDIEAIVGTPTEPGSFIGIVTKAENGV